MDSTANISILTEMSEESTSDSATNDSVPEKENLSETKVKHEVYETYDEFEALDDGITAYEKYQAYWEYHDCPTKIGLKLQKYCRENYLPIFNHPQTLQRIAKALK